MRILTIILSLVCLSAFAEDTPRAPREVEFTPREFATTKEMAEDGNAISQLILGECYYYGSGVLKDHVKAVKWFKKSAEQGNAEAQSSLGSCYCIGAGVLKDPVESVKWYRKAAEQGDATAQYWLGLYYHSGFVVSKDPVEAYAYYNLAGITFEMARNERDKLEKEMTPSQIEAGQKRSKELQAEMELVAEIKALKEKNDSKSNERVLKILEDNRKKAEAKAEAEANKPKWWEFWR